MELELTSVAAPHAGPKLIVSLLPSSLPPEKAVVTDPPVGRQQPELWVRGLVTRVTAPGAAIDEAVARAAVLARLPREAVRYLRLALAMPADARAAALHGLVSDACHADPGYQERIGRFSSRS